MLYPFAHVLVGNTIKENRNQHNAMRAKVAARKTPSKGGKPDKLMRDALLLELKREARQSDGKLTKRLRIVARKLVDCAEQGEVAAIKEIFDRVDGRVPLAQHLSGPVIDIFKQWQEEFAASTRGLPDPAKIPQDRIDYIDVIPEPGELVQQPAPTPEAEFEPIILPDPNKVSAER